MIYYGAVVFFFVSMILAIIEGDISEALGWFNAIIWICMYGAFAGSRK